MSENKNPSHIRCDWGAFPNKRHHGRNGRVVTSILTQNGAFVKNEQLLSPRLYVPEGSSLPAIGRLLGQRTNDEEKLSFVFRLPE